ncbi:MAG: HU family DNA-binding protein [Candidatus Wallbacteria bacterium]|nr:HU family DNA-binding protein [Candidatus Wallbacteria bacterium]
MKKSMTKRDLAKELAKKINISQAKALRAIQETFYIIENCLKEDGRVVISRFGTFMLKERKPRIGRNPHTREAVPIPARKTPFLKYSANLKKIGR